MSRNVQFHRQSNVSSIDALKLCALSCSDWRAPGYYDSVFIGLLSIPRMPRMEWQIVRNHAPRFQF